MSNSTAITKDIDEKPFPKMMKASTDCTIVAFTEKYKGTVVWTNNVIHSLFDYCEDWNMCFFKDFHGTIELVED